MLALLEPEILGFRKSFTFYYLLGMSSLQLDLLDNAFSYLKSAFLNNEDQNREVILAYGAVLLRIGKRQEGLRLLLDLIQNPQTADSAEAKKAKKMLNLLRYKGQNDDYIEVLTRAPKSWYLPRPFPFLTLMWASLGALVLISAGVALFFGVKAVQNRPPKPSRSNMAVVQLLPDQVLSDYSKPDFQYTLSDREIAAAFQRAKKHLLHFEDNACRVEINRLLHSNASLDVKQKCAVFARELTRPEMKDFKGSFSYEEVAKDPLLYDHCYVKWQGRVSNVEVVHDNQIQFDFLVGYQDRKIIDGIVPASLDHAYLFDETFAYELLARIVPASSAAPPRAVVAHPMSQSGFSLAVVTLRRIAEVP